VRDERAKAGKAEECGRVLVAEMIMVTRIVADDCGRSFAIARLILDICY
jgi:hypothetical protein